MWSSSMPLRIFIVTGRAPGARDRLAQDRAKQGALVRERGAAALAGDLGDGAAEVQVDVVGQVLVGDHADGLADGGRVDAVQLDGARLLGRVEVDQLHGLLVALDQCARRDHLADEEPLPPLNSRHSVRNGALVIPAMGASTTGGRTACGPICS